MRVSPPLLTIREIAAGLGRKTSPCNHFDSNVCTTDSPPDKPWELIPIKGGPFIECIRLRRDRRRIELLANEDYLALEIKAELPFQHFSINQGDKRLTRFEFATEIKAGKKRYPVFTKDGELTARQRELLHSAEFCNLVESLELTEAESLHITSGGFDIYLRGRSFDDTNGILEVAISLAAKLEIPTATPNFEGLPTAFRKLVPLFEIWAASDDQQRANLIDEAKPAELSKFVQQVTPFFKAIDSYLDSFGEREMDESAIALSRLAEAATEAKLRLEELQKH